MADEPAQHSPETTAEAECSITFRVTETERIDYQKSAERCGQSLGEWIRERLNRSAEREAKEA
jgi:predicted HicB family RNase H-like nuclease